MASLLIVEDDRDSAEALAGLLRHAGHYVRMARSGKMALAMIARDIPQLIVLDLGLPEWDGADVLWALKSYAELETVPVVVWTGMGDNSLIVRQVRDMNAAAIVPKGQANYNEILNEVSRALVA